MTVKVIIFDFDGTVGDTFDAIVTITNGLAGEFGYQPVSRDDIERFKNLSSREIIKQSGVALLKIPFLMRKVKSTLNQEIHLLSPVAGIKEVLIELNKQGYHLGIITSNSQDNVWKFLENNDLQDIFDFIYSANNIFGKNIVINRFIKDQNLRTEQVIYVGDETRDIEAARKSNIKVVAVSWGFNAKEILNGHNPDFLIDRPKELLEVIANLDKVTF